MPLYVKFWGTRGSIPTPGNRTKRYGGNTACVEVRTEEALFICDAGSGMRELGLDLLSRGKGPVQARVLISHTHWDHIQGFPFFQPAYQDGSRLQIYDRAPGDDQFFRLLSGQMSVEYFPVPFEDLRAHIAPDHLGGGSRVMDGVKIEFNEQSHPGRSLGFSFVQDNKKVIYATDNEVDKFLLDAKFDRLSPELRLIEKKQVEFIENADLLIADGQYTEAEYATRVGWGHPSTLTLVDYAVQANVKLLCVTHHDPSRSDTEVDELIDSCRKRATQLGSEIQIFPAREGVELKI